MSLKVFEVVYNKYLTSLELDLIQSLDYYMEKVHENLCTCMTLKI